MTPLSSIGGERRSYRGFAQPFVSHAHEHYVIGYVREGRRNLMLNGHERNIGSGDLIVFNPGDVHGCTQVSNDLFAYDSVTLSETILEGIRLKVPTLASSHKASRIAFDEAMNLLDAGRVEEATERILFLASMLEAEEEPKEDEKQALDPSSENVATRVYAHLRGHLANPSSITELATTQGVSEYALIRAYRKRFAITPLQHLMALRVDCACELLAQGLSPSVVAAETGFSDQAHLTRVFKQRIGTTPAAYARMTARES